MNYLRKTLYTILLLPILLGAIPLFIFSFVLYGVLFIMKTNNLRYPDPITLIKKLLEEFE